MSKSKSKKGQKTATLIGVISCLLVAYGIVSFVGSYYLEGAGASLINSGAMSPSEFYFYCALFDPFRSGPVLYLVILVPIGISLFALRHKIAQS